jgi:hypothetical protein
MSSIKSVHIKERMEIVCNDDGLNLGELVVALSKANGDGWELTSITHTPGTYDQRDNYSTPATTTFNLTR